VFDSKIHQEISVAWLHHLHGAKPFTIELHFGLQNCCISERVEDIGYGLSSGIEISDLKMLG